MKNRFTLSFNNSGVVSILVSSAHVVASSDECDKNRDDEMCFLNCGV